LKANEIGSLPELDVWEARISDLESHDLPTVNINLRPGRVMRPAGDRRGTARRLILPPLGAFGLFIGIWYLFSEVLMSPSRRFLIPPPHAVWQSTITNAANRTQLLEALWVTTKVALTGLAIAAVIGIAVAVLMSLASWVEASIYPYAVLVQVMPILAIVPLLGLLFGFSFRSRVIVCVIITLFPVITNTLFGLKVADRDMHDLFSMMKVGAVTRLWKLQFPAAMPAIFAGLRIGGGAAVVGAVVGDFFFQRGDAGLGVLIEQYSTQELTPQLYGVVICSALLGVVIFSLFVCLSKLVTGKWYRTQT
jgi:NitT/TauT family transport system permease protein